MINSSGFRSVSRVWPIWSRRIARIARFCCCCLIAVHAAGCDSPQSESNSPDRLANEGRQAESQSEAGIGPLVEWQSLFNGRDLTGWTATNFGGEGEVSVNDGNLSFGMGYPLTGVNWTGDPASEFRLPVDEYEISLQAMKLDGNDFFCGLTFPVIDSHCSLIVGGWGGTLVGLSCIDEQDASDNDTKLRKNFENDRWYEIRLQVSDSRIRVAIDDQWVIDRDVAQSKLTVRNEVLLSRPLGLCSFDTKATFREIKIRRLE